MNSKTEIAKINSINARIKIPEINEPKRVIILLHGWTGNENSMWIFEPRLPENAILIAPRGLFPVSLGGYGWQENIRQGWPKLEELNPAFDVIHQIINWISDEFSENSDVSFIGFSQGAALGFSYSIQFPGIFKIAAGLSGFLPTDASDYLKKDSLKGMKIFLAHGSDDELVPVNLARGAVDILKNSGAEVTYCEDEVGHKLSAPCFRGLEVFYRRW